tara:strand:+ start:2745 stop:3122 length:378 start_codon:yes stop_codon:yes gene_type:complete
MATIKRLDKRMNVVEEWMKEFEKGTGPAQTLDNLNWLVGQCRTMGAQMQQMGQQNQELMTQLQQNHQLLQEFLDEKELVMDWQIFVEGKQKEADDAVQEQETKSMDVQEQAGDGEKMGKGDPEGK